jgi:ribosomal protein L12E/L44/L45/RPP1/RPP2
MILAVPATATAANYRFHNIAHWIFNQKKKNLEEEEEEEEEDSLMIPGSSLFSCRT